VAPAKVDKEILNKLDDLLQKINSDPDFIADCDQAGQFLLPMSGPDYLRYLTELQAETQKFYDKTPW
jgi:tripartite-type tricarboxylate transporter receptor subunit TctC